MDAIDFSLEFTDAESGQRAYVGVRRAQGQIGLCLSLERGSDIELFLEPQLCERLVEGLQKAISRSGDEKRKS